MIRTVNETGRACLLALSGLLSSHAASGADALGQYGVRGAGLVSCAVYERERQARSSVYHVIAGWMDGYITGSNQHAPETYDVTSFESTEMLAAVISENCKQHPDTTVFAVLRSLLEQASEDRLQAPSEKVTVNAGERSVLIYREVLKRVQTRLADSGLYKGPTDGNFDDATRAALERFQASSQLQATGFPDQVTLWRLLKSAD